MLHDAVHVDIEIQSRAAYITRIFLFCKPRVSIDVTKRKSLFFLFYKYKYKKKKDESLGMIRILLLSYNVDII